MRKLPIPTSESDKIVFSELTDFAGRREKVKCK